MSRMHEDEDWNLMGEILIQQWAMFVLADWEKQLRSNENRATTSDVVGRPWFRWSNNGMMNSSFYRLCHAWEHSFINEFFSEKGKDSLPSDVPAEKRELLFAALLKSVGDLGIPIPLDKLRLKWNDYRCGGPRYASRSGAYNFSVCA